MTNATGPVIAPITPTTSPTLHGIVASATSEGYSVGGRSAWMRGSSIQGRIPSALAARRRSARLETRWRASWAAANRLEPAVVLAADAYQRRAVCILRRSLVNPSERIGRDVRRGKAQHDELEEQWLDAF